MDQVRIGLIGVDNMGKGHTKYLMDQDVKGGVLTAIFDTDPKRFHWVREYYGDGGIPLFDDLNSFFASNVFDAVLVATPHYDHPPLAIEAFKHGYHVLIEMPADVYTKKVREMNEAAVASGKTAYESALPKAARLYFFRGAWRNSPHQLDYLWCRSHISALIDNNIIATFFCSVRLCIHPDYA